MSTKTDRARKRESRLRRIDDANAKVELLKNIRDAWNNCTGLTAIARRFEIANSTAWEHLTWLGLEDDKRSRVAKLESADKRIRLGLSVVAAYADGFMSAGDGEVHAVSVYLGLETGRRWKATGVRTGRLHSKAAVLEVRP